jgi:hypothetical protein
VNHVIRRFSFGRVTSREKVTVLAGAVVLALTLVYAFGISPFLDAAANRREMVTAEREALARQLAVIRASSATTVEMETASRILYAAMPRLFSSPADEGGTVAALAAIDAHMERLATASRVRVDRISVKPDSIRGPGVLTRVNVTIGASAGIPALTDLLHELERGEKLIRISRVRLLGVAADPGQIRLLSFELELDAFILTPRVPDAPSTRI